MPDDPKVESPPPDPGVYVTKSGKPDPHVETKEAATRLPPEKRDK